MPVHDVDILTRIEPECFRSGANKTIMYLLIIDSRAIRFIRSPVYSFSLKLFSFVYKNCFQHFLSEWKIGNKEGVGHQ